MQKSMQSTLILVCLLTCANCLNETTNCSRENQEVQFISLFRHGDRTPTKRYNFENLRWAWGEGVLTIQGMIRAYRLGQKFKQMINFNSTAQTSQIQVYSDVAPRTIDTANSLLMGLYLSPEVTPYSDLQACIRCRPSNGSRASISCLAQCMNISNQKIPKIPEIDLNERVVLAIQQTDDCKEFQDWYKLLQKTPGYRFAEDVSYVNVLETLKKLNGSNKKICAIGGHCHKIDLKWVEKVWSNLECAMSAKQNYIVGYTNEELYELLNPVAEYFWRSLYPTSQGSITGGILLNYVVNILNETKSKIENNETVGQRVVFFSGHDHTIFGLLSAMGGVEGVHLPDFCSHVSFSVIDVDCQVILEVRYDEELIGVPGCPHGECLLQDFINQMKYKVMPLRECSHHEE